MLSQPFNRVGRQSVIAAWACCMAAAATGSPARAAIVIDFVNVGNPGNANDVGTNRTYGAVSAEYSIMKYEFTNSQYVTYLNAVDPQGLNPQGIYNTNMGSNVLGGISFTSGNADGTKYSAKTNFAEKPVNYVSYYDAVRVANWLHNGAQTYLTTNTTASAPQNTGAYTLGIATSGTTVTKNAGALYWLPTESEWYKAAYYNGDTSSYTNYGNGFSTPAPTATTSGATGIGTAGDTGNFANYNKGAQWTNGSSGAVTTVGTNGGPSFYGVFDMSGNVQEWNSLSGTGGTGGSNPVGFRGGQWGTTLATDLSGGSRYTTNTAIETNGTGFRLASVPVVAPVPEPGTLGLACCGASVAFGAWRVKSRRRSSRAARGC